MNFHLSSKKLFVVASISVALSLSACTSNNTANPASSMSAPMTNGGMTDKETSLSAADVMFLQMMIPHHEQTVEMSMLAISNTENEDVLSLAARIEAAQQPEIELMQKWLTDAGQPLTADHGMGDSGMMTLNDMSALESAKDNDFDELYLTGMINHHNGAIDMARSVASSANADVSTLANNIIKSQTDEIAEMTALLK
ncbi:MAG: DUF305 domain-containing protein [Actinobacteria bacterium]|uniref:Unannotated protein n=1 Tax=freshwater metagenome TaxID=449393 RepID=A0A6J5YV66_9ZZZZ|nr:DUF305 domain-containing protein [Actinomycetota bacterium]